MKVVTSGSQMKSVLRQAGEDVQKEFVEIHKKLTFDAFYNIIRLNPVKTGYSRSMWHISVGPAAPDGDISAPKDANKQQHAAAYSAPTIQFGDNVHLYNNVTYIGLLEHGHSLQAPQGMAEPTRVKIQAIADQVLGMLARKVLNV